MAKKPTRQDSEAPQIERLISELYDDFEMDRSYRNEYPRFLQVEVRDLAKAKEAVERREEELKQDAKLKRLNAEVAKAEQAIADKKAMWAKRYKDLKRRYYAKGATPEVVKGFQQLVEDMSK